MSFQTMPIDPPAGLATPDFTLRPITADDAEIDHAAVMESRDYLRVWEQSTWPTDDFTVAANRKDLIGLETRHNERRAFTYTVLDPSGTECLGCVYLMPCDGKSFAAAHITALADDSWEDQEAAVYFWVRRSQLAARTDRTLLAVLRAWLDQQWPWQNYVIVTNEQFTQQVELIEDTDLELRFRIEKTSNPGDYLAYTRPR